jgi:hypothetical protein
MQCDAIPVRDVLELALFLYSRPPLQAAREDNIRASRDDAFLHKAFREIFNLVHFSAIISYRRNITIEYVGVEIQSLHRAALIHLLHSLGDFRNGRKTIFEFNDSLFVAARKGP